VGLSIWWLPFGLEPAAHKALAIAAFMVVYWIMEPIEHGITALLGCFLFWALQVTTFSSAFRGFTHHSPWFIFGALLMGKAASRTGLAKRIGYLVMHRVGTSYSQLLLGIITLVWLLNFLIPAPTAELAIMAPLVIGIVAAFELEPRSNVAKGLFIILTYTCSLFSKMNLAASSTILTRGIIETQAGIQVWWSQWFIAHVPAALITIVASWLIIRWLYPPERHTLPGGKQYLQVALQEMGPWNRAQKTTLAWLLVAVSLWATDFWHHTHPAAIALGIGLLLTLPQVGVLDSKAVKQVNFLLIIFVSGAISMGHILTETGALDLATDHLMSLIIPLPSNAVHAAMTLYWGGFLYHLLLGDPNAMVSTSLPILLKLVEGQGYNAMLVGMIWSFASGGILFVYQSAVSVLGYSFGYFEGKDLLKVGAVLTLVEGAILLVLVPVYWPLIGLPWQATPTAQVTTATVQAATVSEGDTIEAVAEPRPRTSQSPAAVVIQQAQARLAQLGFDPGPIDGQLGPRMAAALRPFQATYGLPESGRIDRATLSALHLDQGRPDTALIRQVQAGLRHIGFDPGPVDGRPGPRTTAALRQFQASHGLGVTGKVDDETLAALANSMRQEDRHMSEFHEPNVPPK